MSQPEPQPQPQPGDDSIEMVLPEGSVVECELLIVTYLDPDGKEMYSFDMTEGAQMTGMIGVLEMVQAHLVHLQLSRDNDQD